MATRKKQSNSARKRKAPTTGREKRSGRTTVKSSNRIRAQRAGQSDKVLPGRRGKSQGSSVINDTDEEVYGVLLSERRRLGEAVPAVPEKKVKTTQSSQPKKTPRTGIAKERRS